MDVREYTTPIASSQWLAFDNAKNLREYENIFNKQSIIGRWMRALAIPLVLIYSKFHLHNIAPYTITSTVCKLYDNIWSCAFSSTVAMPSLIYYKVLKQVFFNGVECLQFQ